MSSCAGPHEVVCTQGHPFCCIVVMTCKLQCHSGLAYRTNHPSSLQKQASCRRHRRREHAERQRRCYVGADERAIHVGGPRVEPFRVGSGRTDSVKGGCCDLDAHPWADLAFRKAGEQLSSSSLLELSAFNFAINKPNGDTYEHGGVAPTLRLLRSGLPRYERFAA